MTDPLDLSNLHRKSARAQLKNSAQSLRSRLSPQSIKQDLVDQAKERLDAVANTARKRPVATVGVIAAAALILLRKPLFGVLKRLSKEK